MDIGDWKTNSIFKRYQIVAPEDQKKALEQAAAAQAAALADSDSASLRSFEQLSAVEGKAQFAIV